MRSMLTAAVALIACGAVAEAAPTAWVSSERDHTISIIDIETLEVIETVDVGRRPRGLVFSHDYEHLYICASDDDTVQVMDVATRKILHNLPSGYDPEFFALHPDNRHLYIANEDDAITTVVDVVERRVVAQIDVGIEPEGMAVSHDGRYAVTTSETTNMVHWIDTETHELVHNTLVDQRPRYAKFTADDSLLWASAEIGGTVHVIDVATKEIVHTIDFAIPGVHQDNIQPVGFRLDEDRNTAWIALGPANHVAAVNMTTYEVEDYLLVGRRVWHVDFSPDMSLLFTTNGVTNDVSVIDVEARRVIKSIPVGRFPWGVVTMPSPEELG